MSPDSYQEVKPYNNILKNLCEAKEMEFIDNHDSFILASDKLPLDFFLPDRINLNFLGTRTLVHNIHEHCIVLPKRDQSRQRLILVWLRNILAIAIRVETNGMCNSTRISSLGLDSDVVSVSCFGVRASLMFHFMFVHYTFRSVWVAEWPPFGK